MVEHKTMSPPYTLIDVPSTGSTDFHDIPNTFCIDMALMHNVLLRGLNSIYEKALVVKPGDEIAFAGYCLTAVDSIHVHHRGEEQILFPHLGKRLDMSENLREHEEFSGPLDAFQQYMKSVFDRQEKFDAEKTRALLRGFGDFMAQHLHDEVCLIGFLRVLVIEPFPDANNYARPTQQIRKVRTGRHDGWSVTLNGYVLYTMSFFFCRTWRIREG